MDVRDAKHGGAADSRGVSKRDPAEILRESQEKRPREKTMIISAFFPSSHSAPFPAETDLLSLNIRRIANFRLREPRERENVSNEAAVFYKLCLANVPAVMDMLGSGLEEHSPNVKRLF